MIHCHNCINWVDESLEKIEADKSERPHIFMGCRIYGFREQTRLESCPHYVESENLYTICSTCRIAVPKVCVCLGECLNCTDTDLFCLDHCIGGDQRKYCTHFVRLYTEGAHLIHQDQVYDLFPAIGMPGEKKAAAQAADDADRPMDKAAGDDADPFPGRKENHE